MLNPSRNNIQQANEKFRKGDYQSALVLYRELLKSDVLPRQVVEFNIKYCEQKLASATEGAIAAVVAERPVDAAPAQVSVPAVQVPAKPIPPKRPPEVTVTLTTIKSRLPKIGAVIASLHKQNYLPKKIVLNLSHEPYLLDEGVAEDDPHLAELLKMPLLEVNWVANIGPYRKIWPLLEEHFSNTVTKDKFFVTVDDDTLYPDYFIERLLAEYEKHDCVIAFRGRHIESTPSKIKAYSEWDIGHPDATLSNLPTGKDGVLYHTKFFTREFLDLKDALELAPTADDLWIKWHCATNGVPAVILNPEACTSDYKGFPVVDYSKEYRSVSLYSTHNSAASKGKNDVSVERLEEYLLNKYGYNLLSLINSATSESK